MKNKKTKNFLLILLACVIFVIGIFLGNVLAKNKDFTNQISSESTQTVEIEVGTQTIENTLTGSGEISASSTDKIELSTSNYFKTMCVEEDDIVLAGENILEYTNGTYLTAEYNCLINSYSVPETGNICTSSNYIEVQNLETMTMNLQISESEINKVAKGQEVKIEVTALEDTDYTGTIKSVSGIGTYSTSGTTFNAIVEFENDGNIKPGMSASCTVILEKAENCVAIPIEAVQTRDEQKYVVVVDEQGNTENVNIETGISNDTYVQVTSGLSGGEKIQMLQTVSSKNSDLRESRGSQGNEMNFQREEMPGGNGEMPDMPQPGQF